MSGKNSLANMAGDDCLASVDCDVSMTINENEAMSTDVAKLDSTLP
jgi:hypothetical protein